MKYSGKNDFIFQWKKATHKDRILENADIFDFSLTEEEMNAINAMDIKQRTAGIPEDMLPYYQD